MKFSKGLWRKFAERHIVSQIHSVPFAVKNYDIVTILGGSNLIGTNKFQHGSDSTHIISSRFIISSSPGCKNKCIEKKKRRSREIEAPRICYGLLDVLPHSSIIISTTNRT